MVLGYIIEAIEITPLYDRNMILYTNDRKILLIMRKFIMRKFIIGKINHLNRLNHTKWEVWGQPIIMANAVLMRS